MSDNQYKKLEKLSHRDPLGERVYQELKRGILEGIFAPGELLPEDQLTFATGASRTPVREALMRLQGDGLVRITPRKGACVVELGNEEMNELSEAREAFEVVFFNRAVKSIPRQEFKRIREDMRKVKAEIDAADDDPERMQRKRSEYLEIDFKFHRRLVEAAGNRIWLKYYDGILDRAKLYSHLTVKKNPMLFEQATKEHLAILDAILAGDFSEAKWLLRQHIRNFKNRLTGLINSSDFKRHPTHGPGKG